VIARSSRIAASSATIRRATSSRAKMTVQPGQHEVGPRKHEPSNHLALADGRLVV
jgi:hypothetical protein